MNNNRMVIKTLRFFFYLNHYKVLSSLTRILEVLNVESKIRQVKTAYKECRLLVCKFGFGGKQVEAWVRFWGAVSRPPSLREVINGFPEGAELRIFVSSHAVPPKTFKQFIRRKILFVKVNDRKFDLAYRFVPMKHWFRKLREKAYIRDSHISLFPPQITCDLAYFTHVLESVAVAIKDYMGRQVWFKIYFYCKRIVWLKARQKPRLITALELYRQKMINEDKPPPQNNV